VVSERDDGGPAFPIIEAGEHGRIDEQGIIQSLGKPYRICYGMSLRDYFAGQVIEGMHARDSYDKGQASPEQRARLAYIDADAMLKARKS
jgi:hypothetical protein